MNNITLTDISRLDFNLAVTFLAIWEERSVSRAALRLSLSQSAVSAALARLRQATNDPLFVRAPGGVTPTPRAIAMAGQVRQGVELLRQALVVDRDFDPRASTRHFSIGMSDDFEVAIGPEISRRLLEQAPNASVVFRQTNRHLAERMLEAREIDMALIAGENFPGWIAAEKIGESGYACLLNKKLCRVPLPLSLRDYVSLPHILVSFSGRDGIVDTALKDIGLSRKVHTALTHFSALPAYLAGMKAVATLPSHAAHRLAEGNTLALAEVPVDLGRYSVSTLRRRDVSDDTAMVWLNSIASDAFAVAITRSV